LRKANLSTTGNAALFYVVVHRRFTLESVKKGAVKVFPNDEFRQLRLLTE